MPKHAHHTAKALTQQVAGKGEDLWRQEVVPRLPKGVVEKAKELRAFERVRGIATPLYLLRGLLAYVLCAQASSFRRLGVWAVLVEIAQISDTAWRHRLVKASAWLLWLLGALLAVDPSGPGTRRPERVLLIDATRLREPGGCGDDWRLHTAYDLQAGRVVEVKVTDQHGGKSLQHFGVRAGDIAVADNGYGYRSNVADADSRQAWVVFSFTPSTFPVEDQHGKPIAVLAWLKKKGPIYRSAPCWCQWKGQRYQVRLVALKVPPSVAQRRREEKRVVEGKVVRKGDEATPPYQRLLTTGVLSQEQQERLQMLYEQTNPLALRQEIYERLALLWDGQSDQAGTAA